MIGRIIPCIRFDCSAISYQLTIQYTQISITILLFIYNTLFSKMKIA